MENLASPWEIDRPLKSLSSICAFFIFVYFPQYIAVNYSFPHLFPRFLSLFAIMCFGFLSLFNSENRQLVQHLNHSLRNIEGPKQSPLNLVEETN